MVCGRFARGVLRKLYIAYLVASGGAPTPQGLKVLKIIQQGTQPWVRSTRARIEHIVELHEQSKVPVSPQPSSGHASNQIQAPLSVPNTSDVLIFSIHFVDEGLEDVVMKGHEAEFSWLTCALSSSLQELHAPQIEAQSSAVKRPAEERLRSLHQRVMNKQRQLRNFAE